jgi:hypothetical protein
MALLSRRKICGAGLLKTHIIVNNGEQFIFINLFIRIMEVWGVAKLVLNQYRSKNQIVRVAYAVVSDTAAVLEPGTKVVLLFRHKDGTVYQVEGRVSRLWKNMHYAEVRIPWTAAAALAEYAGRSVAGEGKVVVYDYAVRLKGVRPPPLR